MKRHRHYRIDFAAVRDRCSRHQRAQRLCEIASPPVLEPMNRVSNWSPVLEDSARSRSWFEKRLASLAENGSTRLLTSDAARWSKELNKALDEMMHTPTSAIRYTSCAAALVVIRLPP